MEGETSKRRRMTRDIREMFAPKDTREEPSPMVSKENQRTSLPQLPPQPPYPRKVEREPPV